MKRPDRAPCAASSDRGPGDRRQPPGPSGSRQGQHGTPPVSTGAREPPPAARAFRKPPGRARRAASSGRDRNHRQRSGAPGSRQGGHGSRKLWLGLGTTASAQAFQEAARAGTVRRKLRPGAGDPPPVPRASRKPPGRARWAESSTGGRLGIVQAAQARCGGARGPKFPECPGPSRLGRRFAFSFFWTGGGQSTRKFARNLGFCLCYPVCVPFAMRFAYLLCTLS